MYCKVKGFLSLSLGAADFDACQGDGENEPEHAHDAGIVPQVICKTANQAAAHGSTGGAGDGACRGIAAVADRMGSALDVPQHGGHKAHKTQQAGLDPDLQEEVMGMDKGRLGMVKVHILDEFLGRRRAQTSAGDRRFLNHCEGRLIQGEAACGGSIIGVCDGQDSVPDGGRDKRHRHNAQNDEGRDQLRLPQEHHDHHSAGKAHPAGAGISHGQRRAAYQEGSGGYQLCQRTLGAEDQRQGQGQEHDKDFREGIGVIEEGIDAAGHTGVDLHIHKGLVDLHALNTLVDAVQARHQHAHGTAGHKTLQIVTGADSTDGHQHTERRRDVINQEAEGQGRRVGEQDCQEHGAEQYQRIESDAPQIQTELLSPVHGAGMEQHQQHTEAHEAVSIVPALKGNDPQQHDEPGLGDGRLVTHPEGQTGEETVLKGHPQRAVELMEQVARQIHQPGEQAAQQAVRPRFGNFTFPADHAQQTAAVNLAVAPGADGIDGTAEAAVQIGGRQDQPQAI